MMSKNRSCVRRQKVRENFIIQKVKEQLVKRLSHVEFEHIVETGFMTQKSWLQENAN